MQIDLAALPDDPTILQQMLRDVVAVAAQEQVALQGAVREREAENDKLRLLIQRLLRNRFGRRSEQLSPDQLQFGLEDLEQTIAEGEAAQEAAAQSEVLRQQRRSAQRSCQYLSLGVCYFGRYRTLDSPDCRDSMTVVKQPWVKSCASGNQAV